MPRTAPRGLIVTADDFGLHEAVNEAVERAHWDGVLSAASLMVGAPAAEDAIARAKRAPKLRVGLHLVLADGHSTLSREKIPDLVDAEGRFGDAMARDGFRFFFLPQVRRQLALEIEAQFALFQKSGLALDHVNAHKHFHLHPTVLSLIIAARRRYPFPAIRLPLAVDPPMYLRPWLSLMRLRLDRAGIAHNDRICGIAETGAMDERALLAALARLPDGVTEIYSHPATQEGITRSMASYRPTDELEALLSPCVREAVDSLGVKRGGFSDFWPPRGAA
ncbi:MAG: hopanoid biosynthesis-associated protein HpnK [Methylocystis sp.]